MGEMDAGTSISTILAVGIAIFSCVLLHFFYKNASKNKEKEAEKETEKYSG